MKFQEGGMAPQASAPAPAPAQDPIQMLAEMAIQALQTQDCQVAMQVCEGFVQLIQQAQGAQQAPVGDQSGEVVFKKGGKMVRRKKCKK